MNVRLRIVTAILGCMVAAVPAIAQGNAKLAVGPDAGGYLCPDGRQLYVKSCYDTSPDATCGVVLMHVPPLNGFQRESSSTRATLTSGVAACKVYPVEFKNDGTVGLVVPKSPPQQVAKAPGAAAPKASTAAPPVATGDTLDLTVADGMAFGQKGVPSSLVRISANSTSRIFYVDEASRKATARKDVITIWSLMIYVDGKPPVAGAAAVWIENYFNCKLNSFEQQLYISLDRQAKVLIVDAGDESGKVAKNSVIEAILGVACKTIPPSKGPRFTSAKAAIDDAFAGAAPKTAAKPATPAAKPVVVAKPIKAPIRLPQTETEKKVFDLIKQNLVQAAVSAILRSPDGKLATLTELTDKDGMTALHWATANQNAAATRWLLDKSSKFDRADQKGRTPLRIALDNKDTRVMTMLLDRGADARFALTGHDDELKGFKKTSELADFMIATAGAAAIADVPAPKTAAKPATPATKPVVIAKPTKASIRLPKTESEKKFFQAMKEGRTQAAINVTIDAPDGKTIPITTLTDERGMTALHWAAANRDAAIIRWLLEKGSDANLADQKGRTPLKIALENKDAQVMTLLLNIGGADANLAWPGHADELNSFKSNDDLVDFMIKTAAPAKN